MKQHIVSLPHHPKRVIIISLIVAGALGVFGYVKINKKPVTSVVIDNSGVSAADTNSSQNLSLGFLTSGRIKDVFVKAGDTVKKDEVLATLDAGNAMGVLEQAKAAYASAQASLAIVLQQTSSSKNNVDNVTSQQDTLVKNAYQNLLNSTPEAIPTNHTENYTAPVITGTYGLDKEGTINLHFYYSAGGQSFTASGLTSGTSLGNTITAQPIGDSGLYLSTTSTTINNADWIIEIPNKKAANYLSNYNNYQSALATRNKAIADAKASIGTTSSVSEAQIAQAQAQVNSALGTVQIAEAAYDNTIITAPADGTVVSVSIAPGQIATVNAPAILFTSNTSTN